MIRPQLAGPARALLDSLPSLTLVVDGEGRVLAASREALARLGPAGGHREGRGGTVGEFLGCARAAGPGVCGLQGACEACSLGGGVRAAMAGHEVQGLPVMLRVRDEARSVAEAPALMSARRLELDGAVCAVLTVEMPVPGDGGATGLTELVGAREALAESERRHRLLADNAHDVIWTMDVATGRFTYVSPSITRLRGMSVGEALAEPLEEALCPDSYAKVVDHIGRLGQPGGLGPPMGAAASTDVYDQPCRDGTIKHVEITTTAIVDARGGVSEILGVSRDVTDRVRAEKALRESEAQLRQSQKMEAVGRLAGGMAHDFNNLLSVILSSVHMAHEQAGACARVRDDLEEIRLAAERARVLTSQLLAFSRRQVLQPRLLDLNALVRGVERMVRRLIGEDVVVWTGLQPGLGHVEADPGQLEQVLLNLVVNARDAMPRGGKLSIETAGVELDATYAACHVTVRPGPYVLLAVSDTGTGMDGETLARVFEPFFTTKELGRGTGLGLSTVYGIVKQSGGHVWAYSEPGQGTTFKIYLPRARPSQAGATLAVAQGAWPSASARPGETVLIVEDSEPVRRLARRVLESFGYLVVAAAGLEEALALVSSNPGPIHLLLADVVMPGGSGPEVARRIGERVPGLRVLYMSGYTDELVVNHGLLGATQHFLQKPFTADSLGQRVRQVLDADPARSPSPTE